MITLNEHISQTFIIGACLISILFGFINALLVLRIKITTVEEDMMAIKDDARYKKYQEMKHISDLIADGASAFLHEEYIFISIFVVIFAGIICLTVENEPGQLWTVIPFLLGALTSLLSGYIGMKIAVKANVRCCKEATFNLHRAFIVAFRGGIVLGFVLVGLALLVLQILIMAYQKYYLTGHGRTQQTMFECIAGYGLGGSTIALFGRVGGGIYTKAADVGSDLVGKVIAGLNEDSAMNPGVIADNVGDNVGDIAGMGSDLFGSFAESTCACLIISASSTQLVAQNAFYYPLLISASGIIVCLFTSFLSSHVIQIESERSVEISLKVQLIVSTILMTPVLYYLAYHSLPDHFTFNSSDGQNVNPWSAFICSVMGLWGGLVIGSFTEYYTSNHYAPVQKLSRACQSGAAPNIIHGLALGFHSTIVPVVAIAITIFVSFYLANMYGISLAALGMLSTLSIGLTIDGYGPIADNSGGIAEMCELEEARKRTDILDAAGNTTAAIGKGFAIGSACLVALALFGAFVTRSHMKEVNILKPLEFAGLILGSMLPYAFSAMTMNSVGDAAQEMIQEIVRQFNTKKILEGLEEPDYHRCIEISTKSSIKQMVAPGLLVVLSPIVMGFLFGPRGVSGLVAGAIASGIQIAISFSNAGGAWDNAKKYIEGNKLIIDGVIHGKKSECHKAAVIGDTVGDPLKDTSGPSINILIKLMAITSLVFSGAFEKYGGILLKYQKNLLL